MEFSVAVRLVSTYINVSTSVWFISAKLARCLKAVRDKLKLAQRRHVYNFSRTQEMLSYKMLLLMQMTWLHTNFRLVPKMVA